MRKSLIIATIFLAIFLLVTEQVITQGFLTQANKPINLFIPTIQKEPFILFSKVIHYFFDPMIFLPIILIISGFLGIIKERYKSMVLVLVTGLTAIS